MYNLSGKVVFVTGAGGEHGIGRGIAHRLAEDGADVVVTDYVEKPYPDAEWGGLPALKAELEGLGRRFSGPDLRCDRLGLSPGGHAAGGGGVRQNRYSGQ